MACQIVMDHTGDRRHSFDALDAEALARAEERLRELSGQDFIAAEPAAAHHGVRYRGGRDPILPSPGRRLRMIAIAPVDRARLARFQGQRVRLSARGLRFYKASRVRLIGSRLQLHKSRRVGRRKSNRPRTIRPREVCGKASLLRRGCRARHFGRHGG
jgi:hypothetical protein